MQLKISVHHRYTAAQRSERTLNKTVKVLHFAHDVRQRNLGRRGRRRRTHIGDHVGDREIGLMADGGDNGDARCGDRPRHRFLVERPQVLCRPPSPADDDHVDVLGVQQLYPLRYRCRRSVSLHRRRRNEYVGREPFLRNAYDVMYDRAVKGCDHAHGPRIPGQLTFSGRVEETFRLKLLFQLFQCEVHVAEPGTSHRRNLELIPSPGDVHVNGTERRDLHACRRLERQCVPRASEKDAFQCALRILQREIIVSLRRYLQCGDLSRYPNVIQGNVRGQGGPCPFVEFRYRYCRHHRGEHTFILVF